ncbi:MAG: ATP-binding protein [Myxococcota bacterium]
MITLHSSLLRRTPPRPAEAPSRERPAVLTAERKLAYADALLRCSDPEACAHVALGLLQNLGVRAAVCTLLQPEDGELRAVAGLGVAPALWEDLHISVQETSHPLVVALGGTEPVLVNREQVMRLPGPPPPFPAFHAVPLIRAEAEGGPGLGLVLIQHTAASELGEELLWVCGMLSAKLVGLDYRRLLAAEKRYKRERAHFHSIIDAVTDPILLTDMEGRIIIANSRAESLFSAPEGTSEGRRRAVALNNMLFSAALFTTMEDADARRRELLLVDPSEGRDLLFELLSTPFVDPHGGGGVVSVLRNITDLRSATAELEENYRRLRVAEAEMRAERDRLDLIISSVADPILVTDPGGSIVLMNPPAQRLFEVEGEQRGEEATRRVRANDAVFSSFMSNLYTGHMMRWRGELGLVDPHTGTTIPVEAIAGKVLTKGGEVTAIVTILHDRTEALEKARLYDQVKRHSEELKQRVNEATAELAAQNELLRRQAMALEQASEMKSQFLATMSHELRTPLNAIIGYTQLLLQGISGEVPPPQHKKLTRIASNAQHLLSLINDLLDITRIESGKMPIHVETFELRALIKDVMAEVEPIIARTQLTVTQELPEELPELRSDRQKVKQVVLNLLSNALKFTPAGSVQVQVRHDVERDTVSISVKDTGIGIPEAEQQRIFEDFRQADNSYTRQYGGTGLGLSICRRLAAMLGGHISLESQVGVGSTFTLHLPRQLRRK